MEKINTESKPVKSVEQSLGYIAWDIKTIAQELKKITEYLEQIVHKEEFR